MFSCGFFCLCATSPSGLRRVLSALATAAPPPTTMYFACSCPAKSGASQSGMLLLVSLVYMVQPHAVQISGSGQIPGIGPSAPWPQPFAGKRTPLQPVSLAPGGMREVSLCPRPCLLFSLLSIFQKNSSDLRKGSGCVCVHQHVSLVATLSVGAL